MTKEEMQAKLDELNEIVAYIDSDVADLNDLLDDVKNDVNQLKETIKKEKENRP